MNKIIVLALLFVFSTCRLKMDSCKFSASAPSPSPSLYIDTTSGDYKYNVDFDWTDEDSIEFKVPFTSKLENNSIIPFFINASTVSAYDNKDFYYVSEEDVKNDNTKTLYKDLNDSLIYNKIHVFYPFDYYFDDNKSTGKLLKATIKGDDFKANPNDVNQKFIKYFGWAVCSGNKKVKTKVSNILVTFNNGNYFSISKILLATLALLFL
jgi:hypothetical protein